MNILLVLAGVSLLPVVIVAFLNMGYDLLHGMEDDWDYEEPRRPYRTPEQRMVQLEADLEAAYLTHDKRIRGIYHD